MKIENITGTVGGFLLSTCSYVFGMIPNYADRLEQAFFVACFAAVGAIVSYFTTKFCKILWNKTFGKWAGLKDDK